MFWGYAVVLVVGLTFCILMGVLQR